MLYFLLLPFFYLVLVFVFPKGNPIQEILYMPVYWLRTTVVSTSSIRSSKHSYGKHRRQYFLWLEPKERTLERKNIILYYHGGGWRFGRPELFKANAKVFTDLGFTVIMPSYRPCPRYKFDAIREDLDATLVAIQQELLLRKLGDKRLILGGMSAGGNLVAHLLYDKIRLQKMAVSPNFFAGIFLCGAPLDLRQMWDSFPLRDFAGKRKETLFTAANPINYLKTKQKTPILCIHGTKDGLVEYESSIIFLEKLKTLQQQGITFHTIPDGTHLDAGSWVHSDNSIRKLLQNWVVEREMV